MKNRVLIAMLCAACLVSATACGKDKNTNDNTEAAAVESTENAKVTYNGKRSGEFELNAEELVTKLCDYSAIPVTVNAQYEVNEANENSYLSQLLSGYGGIAYKENTDKKVVEAGDYVKVNYTGYLDGEAFENGAAENALLDISNNMQVGASSGFIEGFCDGLEGKKVGDKFSHDVTFPEDYSNEDLAGKETTFEFEVLGIYTDEPITFDDLTDDMVSETFGEYTGIDNVKDFKTAVDGDLKNSLYSATVEQVKAYMIENCEVTIPEDYFAARLYEYEESLKEDYCKDGQTLEEYITANGSDTFESYEESWKESITEQIKTELIFGLVADKENIEFDESGFSTYIEYIMNNSNGSFADEDAVYNYFGFGHSDEGEAYLKQQYRVNLAVDKIAEKAVVSYSDANAEEEDGTEAVEETEVSE